MVRGPHTHLTIDVQTTNREETEYNGYMVHCHFLNHHDNGMMQVFAVHAKDEKPRTRVRKRPSRERKV